jgi:hypothetical protein
MTVDSSSGVDSPKKHRTRAVRECLIALIQLTSFAAVCIFRTSFARANTHTEVIVYFSFFIRAALEHLLRVMSHFRLDSRLVHLRRPPSSHCPRTSECARARVSSLRFTITLTITRQTIDRRLEFSFETSSHNRTTVREHMSSGEFSVVSSAKVTSIRVDPLPVLPTSKSIDTGNWLKHDFRASSSSQQAPQSNIHF